MSNWKLKALNELYLTGSTEAPTQEKMIVLEDILLYYNIDYNIQGENTITINKGHEKVRELI